MPITGAAGVAAAAGAAAIGLTPSLTASPQLVAEGNTVWYLRGTEIGDNPSDGDYEDFIGEMMTGAEVTDPGSKTKVDYPASFFPVTTGYLDALTFDASVGEGLDHLEESDVEDGDVIFGFSQGAVVASEYKRNHLHDDKDLTYVLVENPDRPNGGILARFDGLSIPILGVTFNGATPGDELSAKTVDVSRQYDGWSDFPAYPLNVLADANAVLGIYYLHGKTQSEVSAEDLQHAEDLGGIYYQNDEATNTEYYLIPTERLPLLMPFDGIVPDPILDAADPPLRVLVELGYKRTDDNGDTDYGTPTTAGIAPAVNPVTVATQLAEATVQGVDTGLSETGASTPNVLTANTSARNPSPASTSASLTNLTARTSITSGMSAPEVKLPNLASGARKPGETPKPLASKPKPFSTKDIADNVRKAMGVSKDAPKAASGGDS
ncbi:PE-PPE domain-containing protein [Mycolicibacterium sp. 120270]|uniref:PE-PPE domain-containing protein n=1 Tax=Mycolicibacterium sp. 120270 TaxID=3090600 RepID=UPI00299EC15C|nr:PE-PPE domain-containing protein [Mycolicibacterium sp. 120270]MDX1882179.1 PE-PPE domain-containing protein [Mycolicibacterium sp. 120270]